MVWHEVRVHPSAARLPREAQLTWKLAELAAAAPPPEAAVADMVACRVVDNAGVALAAINRQPVATARVMAPAHPRPMGRRSSDCLRPSGCRPSGRAGPMPRPCENWTSMIVCRRAPIRATISRR